MTRRMLIDATHPEETRVTVVSGNKLEEFDYETTTKAQLKGNIYLAKVTRVEPSLQAAFVEYGGNRHGFLAFSEIHPDYYRIPVSDREDLVEDSQNGDDDNGDDDRRGPDGEPVEDMGGAEAVDEAVEEAQRRRPRLKRQYKIQEVIKRRQVMLVQVVKEERGTKGAALTTYLSLAGRYCVLMPNTSRGGGVSRKIANAQDRKRLKTVMSELETPEGMAVILRTAGAERSKAEIKRDFEYILKLWDDIRQKTLQSTAPALIHEEANLIKRSIRDLYSKDIEEVLVAGEEAYKTAKDFMKALVPSHAKKVQRYKDEQGVPLFHRYQVEQQLAQIHEPQVQLRSGGTIVIHQTEALVAIDVNSGRATKERHIEETALKTNMEAAEEVARQLRLRDLAGLIVIDFIDMDDNRNIGQVERKLKESLRRDRARIQVGRISAFGLMEMSRQRLRPSLIEAMSQPCPTCGGVGYIASTETAALICLRSIEEEGLRKRSAVVKARVPVDVALYILNHKRAILSDMEAQYGFRVTIEADSELLPPKFELTRTAQDVEDATEQPVEDLGQQSRGGERSGSDRSGGDRSGGDRSGDDNARRRGKRGGRRRGGRDEDRGGERGEDRGEDRDDQAAEAEEAVEDRRDAAEGEDDSESDRSKRRRKRGRRGGRRRNRRPEDGDQDQQASDDADGDGSESAADTAEEAAAEPGRDEAEKPKRPRARRSRRKAPEGEASEAGDGGERDPEGESAPQEVAKEAAAEAAPKPRRRRASKKREEPAEENAEAASGTGDEGADPDAEAAPESAPDAAPDAAEKPAKKARAKRPGRKRKTDAPAKPEPAAPAPDESVNEPAADAGAQSGDQPTPESESQADPLEQYVVTDGSEKKGEKPKRKGWWNRMLG
ncbi:MAG: ribonuclease E/G [Marivibrio sp.]|uniref:Rne/Rng family ribonuclease n=1 Tax=Marivibrio sp. TaxID=2039719 RepID=UPI0032EF596C